MLWTAVHLPNLPLEALTRLPDDGAPRCVVEHHVVLAANAAAHACGVQPGVRKTTALALLPALEILERKPAEEQRWMEAIALALLRFSPQVALEQDCVLLEVEGSARLFGGMRRLLGQIHQAVVDCGVDCRMATATTPTAASLIGRSGLRRRHALKEEVTHALLNDVPVRFMISAGGHLEVLQSLGCETLADVRKLPRGGVKRRFGSGLLLELDQAYGEEADMRVAFQAPESFRAGVELMARVDNAQALLFVARRLVQQLCGWLAAHWTAAAGLRLVMKHESSRRGQPESILAVALAEATRDPGHVIAVLKERLERFVLKAPVYHLTLEVERVVPFAGENASFFPDPARAETDFTRLIDRLKARLGEESVHRLALVEDFRPEHAFRRIPVNNQYPKEVEAPPLPRPTWLLPAPLKLQEHENRPFYRSPLALVAGPERIEYGWYDGALIQRDYYVAEDEAHALLWIFRERNALEGGWYLHGLFG